MEKDDAKISPLAAVLAVLATFLLILVFSVVLGIVELVLNVNEGVIYTSLQSLTLILGELLIMVIPLSLMLSKRVNVGKYIGSKTGPKAVVLGIGLGVLLLFFDIFVSAGLVAIFGETTAMQESTQQIEDLGKSALGLVSLIVTLSLAGVCEEFTFRGFLQNAINSKYSFGVSLLVSSLAFGLFHLDLQGVYIIWAFLMGLVLGFIYNHWHSYTISAITHATVNLIVLAITFIH